MHHSFSHALLPIAASHQLPHSRRRMSRLMIKHMRVWYTQRTESSEPLVARTYYQGNAWHTYQQWQPPPQVPFVAPAAPVSPPSQPVESRSKTNETPPRPSFVGRYICSLLGLGCAWFMMDDVLEFTRAHPRVVCHPSSTFPIPRPGPHLWFPPTEKDKQWLPPRLLLAFSVIRSMFPDRYLAVGVSPIDDPLQPVPSSFYTQHLSPAEEEEAEEHHHSFLNPQRNAGAARGLYLHNRLCVWSTALLSVVFFARLFSRHSASYLYSLRYHFIYGWLTYSSYTCLMLWCPIPKFAYSIPDDDLMFNVLRASRGALNTQFSAFNVISLMPLWSRLRWRLLCLQLLYFLFLNSPYIRTEVTDRFLSAFKIIQEQPDTARKKAVRSAAHTTLWLAEDIWRESRYLLYCLHYWQEMSRLMIHPMLLLEHPPMLVTLCNLHRTSNPLEADRCSAVLSSLLSHQAVNQQLLFSHLDGRDVVVDESRLFVKPGSAQCVQESYTHKYQHHLRDLIDDNDTAVRRTTRNADVYLHFPVICRDSGMRGIIAVQAQPVVLPSDELDDRLLHADVRAVVRQIYHRPRSFHLPPELEKGSTLESMVHEPKIKDAINILISMYRDTTYVVDPFPLRSRQFSHLIVYLRSSRVPDITQAVAGGKRSDTLRIQRAVFIPCRPGDFPTTGQAWPLQVTTATMTRIPDLWERGHPATTILYHNETKSDAKPLFVTMPPSSEPPLGFPPLSQLPGFKTKP